MYLLPLINRSIEVNNLKGDSNWEIVNKTTPRSIIATIIGSRFKQRINLTGFKSITEINNVFDVKAFGAKCDGVTDDSDSFEKALNYVSSLNVKSEVKVSGTLKLTRTFSFQSNFVLTGSKFAKIKADFKGTSLFTATDKKDICISNIKFEANTSTVFLTKQVNNIEIKNCVSNAPLFWNTTNSYSEIYNNVTSTGLSTNIVIKNCNIRGKSKAINTRGAIELRYVKDVEISGLIVNNCSAGILWWGGNAATEGVVEANPRWAKNINITNCYVNGAGSGCIWGSMGENITITNCTVKNSNDVGLDSEGSNYVTFSNCVASNCANAGISTFFLNRFVTFSNCTINGADNHFLLLVKNPGQSQAESELKVIGCTFNNIGIGISKCIGNSLKNIDISNCIFNNTIIYRDASVGSKDISIANNKLYFNRVIANPFAAILIQSYYGYGKCNITGNEIYSKAMQSVGSIAISVENRDFNSNSEAVIEKNKTFNFPTDIQVKGASDNVGMIQYFYINNNTVGSNKIVRLEGEHNNSYVMLKNNVNYLNLPVPNTIPTVGKWEAGQRIKFAVPTTIGSGKVGAICTVTGVYGTPTIPVWVTY